MCRADASPEAGLIRCYATASAATQNIQCFRCAWLGNGDLMFLNMCTAHALSTALLFILAGVKERGGVYTEPCVRRRMLLPLLPYRYKALVEGHACLCDQILRARKSPASTKNSRGFPPYPKVFTCSSWSGKVDHTSQRYTVAVPPSPYCEPLYALLAREISPSMTLGAR